MTVTVVDHGDLFESGAEVLVDPVNCVGTSGAGLAKEFRKRFPRQVTHYETSARRGLVRVGHDLVFAGTKPTIVFVPTKRHWRDASTIEDVSVGIERLAYLLLRQTWKTVAVPALGCGLGGLAWVDVEPVLRHLLDELPCDVTIYAPR